MPRYCECPFPAPHSTLGKCGRCLCPLEQDGDRGRMTDHEHEFANGRSQSEPVTEKLCPCGGNAWSLDELLALCDNEDQREGWRSILGPNDYYCSDEDDVLLPGQEEDRK